MRTGWVSVDIKSSYLKSVTPFGQSWVVDGHCVTNTYAECLVPFYHDLFAWIYRSRGFHDGMTFCVAPDVIIQNGKRLFSGQCANADNICHARMISIPGPTGQRSIHFIIRGSGEG